MRINIAFHFYAYLLLQISFLAIFYFLIYSKSDICLSQNTKMTGPKFQANQASIETSEIDTYNLIEEIHRKKRPEHTFSFMDCSTEYANEYQLQQDHPCVVHLIRTQYLRKPAMRSLPYNLNDPKNMDPSDGQSLAILRLLRNKTNGFFIECGGYDGEFLSNTLYMERSLNWTGLLIEADKTIYKNLTSRNRKAYTSPVCLSTKPYPMKVLYNATILTLGSILQNDKQKASKQTTDAGNIYEIQCFPLYSILLALNRTTVDYFSLDVEGSEYEVLSTVPWHKLDITAITVEKHPKDEQILTRLMERNKFIKFGSIEMFYSSDVVYIKDFLHDLRQFE